MTSGKPTERRNPDEPASWSTRYQNAMRPTRDNAQGWKPKDLMMMPARVAMALQADGWWLRSEIIWHKPNPMPESVTDRPTSAHEKLFLLSKSARYFYDAEAVRVQRSPGSMARDKRANLHWRSCPTGSNRALGLRWTKRAWRLRRRRASANLRNVWTIPTHSFKEAHFATFPPDLVKPCIKAGTSEKGVCGACGAPMVRQVENKPSTPEYVSPKLADHTDRNDVERLHRVGNKRCTTTGWLPSCQCGAATQPCTVMDPFAGSGTVGQVALSLNRRFIGIEISADYTEMAKRRVMGPLFA